MSMPEMDNFDFESEIESGDDAEETKVPEAEKDDSVDLFSSDDEMFANLASFEDTPASPGKEIEDEDELQGSLI